MIVSNRQKPKITSSPIPKNREVFVIVWNKITEKLLKDSYNLLLGGKTKIEPLNRKNLTFVNVFVLLYIEAFLLRGFSLDSFVVAFLVSDCLGNISVSSSVVSSSSDTSSTLTVGAAGASTSPFFSSA